MSEINYNGGDIRLPEQFLNQIKLELNTKYKNTQLFNNKDWNTIFGECLNNSSNTDTDINDYENFRNSCKDYSIIKLVNDLYLLPKNINNLNIYLVREIGLLCILIIFIFLLIILLLLNWYNT